MGCISKCILILINSVFLVIGIVLIVVGSILVFIPGKILDQVYDSVKDNYNQASAGYSIPDNADDLGDMPFFKTIGIVLLAFGVALFAVSFLAYCGACCTTCCRCLLVLFAIIMVVFVIIEVVVDILFLVADSPLHDESKSQLKDLIKTDYDDDGTDAFSMSMNLIHQHFDCCGIDGVADFGAKEHRSCDAANEQTGCYSKLQDVIDDNIIYCALGLGFLCLLQLLEAYLAITLYKDNKVGPI